MRKVGNVYRETNQEGLLNYLKERFKDMSDLVFVSLVIIFGGADRADEEERKWLWDDN